LGASANARFDCCSGLELLAGIMRGPAAMKQVSSASLIRERKDGSGARVGSVELFFDLVFVFAAHSYRISCCII